MNDLITNIDRLHTTEMGAARIKKNLSIGDVDAVDHHGPQNKGAVKC